MRHNVGVNLIPPPSRTVSSGPTCHLIGKLQTE